MSAVLNLSVFAVRSLFEGFCSSIGFPAGPAADAASRFLGARFTDHSCPPWRLGRLRLSSL